MSTTCLQLVYQRVSKILYRVLDKLCIVPQDGTTGECSATVPTGIVHTMWMTRPSRGVGHVGWYCGLACVHTAIVHSKTANPGSSDDDDDDDAGDDADDDDHDDDDEDDGGGDDDTATRCTSSAVPETNR